jgi:hypothetical protein
MGAVRAHRSVARPSASRPFLNFVEAEDHSQIAQGLAGHFDFPVLPQAKQMRMKFYRIYGEAIDPLGLRCHGHAKDEKLSIPNPAPPFPDAAVAGHSRCSLIGHRLWTEREFAE